MSLGRPVLQKAECVPEEELASLVLSAAAALPRKYQPGIHRKIPLSIRVDEMADVHYETPEHPSKRTRSDILLVKLRFPTLLWSNLRRAARVVMEIAYTILKVHR